MTRILLVDDHPIVRQGIRQVLTSAFHPALVGEAANAEEGLNEARSTEWDVLVLDLTLPGTSGLDLLKDLARECPRCRFSSSACTRPISSRAAR